MGITQSESEAREVIDAALGAAGWAVQDRIDINLGAARGVAVREYKTDVGFADDLLFVDRKPAGVIEAKKPGVTLTGVEAQTQDYAANVPHEAPVPIRPLPFLYESTGVETASPTCSIPRRAAGDCFTSTGPRRSPNTCLTPHPGRRSAGAERIPVDHATSGLYGAEKAGHQAARDAADSKSAA